MLKFLLICLACVGHGRRLQISADTSGSPARVGHAIDRHHGQDAPPTNLNSVLHKLAVVKGQKAVHAFNGAAPGDGRSGLAKIFTADEADRFLQLLSAVVKWTLPLFAFWGALTALFGKTTFFAETPGASAHSIVMAVPMAYFAMKGSQMWLWDKNFVSKSSHDKVWGGYPGIVPLLSAMFAFQVWDFFATLSSPNLREIEHLVHHFCTALMALVTLLNGPKGFCTYYAPFFAGVSEVSSVPLAFMMLFRNNPDFATRFEGINQLCRVTFASLFLSIRCLYWPFVVLDSWKAVLTESVPLALKSVVFAGGIFFTFLQMYWGKLIVSEAIQTL